jgi:hypothetical protein
MQVDELRQCNLTIGAHPTEGKTAILKQFGLCGQPTGPKVNFFTRATFADYVHNYCGAYLIELGSDVPKGVERVKGGGKQKFSKTSCEEKLKFHYDIVHAGEGIFTLDNFKSLLQLWNGLLDEGWWEGGTRFSGTFKIGTPVFPIKHGLILACTRADLDNVFAREVGTLSRTIVANYACNARENSHILVGRRPPNVKINYKNFFDEVASILSHIDSSKRVGITFDKTLNINLVDNVLKLIKTGRQEITGKRAMNDRNTILKAHAHLNNRRKVYWEDLVMVESLLQMCRKIVITPNIRKQSNISGTYYMGDKMHFQLNLRRRIHDDETARNQVKKLFTWWDSNVPLYTESMLDNAIKALNVPIEKVYAEAKIDD